MNEELCVKLSASRLSKCLSLMLAKILTMNGNVCDCDDASGRVLALANVVALVLVAQLLDDERLVQRIDLSPANLRRVQSRPTIQAMSH